MPILPSPLPEDRRQPASRVATQRLEGSHTMISDKLGSFAHVKPVAWVRNRAGDDNSWLKGDYSLPNDHSSKHQPHPSLLEFQQEQARILQRQQVSKAASVESPTTSSIYGAHHMTGDLETSAAVNAIGAEQILEQQAKLWAPLDSTSKRLGFGISQAKEGSPFREIERAQDKKRFMSVAALSYSNPTENKVVIARPESMNRTTCLFPIQPVNKYTAYVLPNRHQEQEQQHATSSARSPQAAASQQLAATQVASPSAAAASSSSPAATLKQQPLALAGSDISTAHSLGYGKRHTFFRHYLSSLPDLS